MRGGRLLRWTCCTGRDRPRAIKDGALLLHEGGESFVTLPPTGFGKEQGQPDARYRLRWMQSVLRCTLRVGRRRQDYLNLEDAPETTFVRRDRSIESDEAMSSSLSGPPVVAFRPSRRHRVRLWRRDRAGDARGPDGAPGGVLAGEGATTASPSSALPKRKKRPRSWRVDRVSPTRRRTRHLEIRTRWRSPWRVCCGACGRSTGAGSSPARTSTPTIRGSGGSCADGARLARYGGVQELHAWPPHRHRADPVLCVDGGSEPTTLAGAHRHLGYPQTVAAWVAAMEAHGSQTSARRYVDCSSLGRGSAGSAPAWSMRSPFSPLIRSLTLASGWGWRAGF